VANKKFSTWYIVVRKVRVIEDASLDDYRTWERLASPEERGATIGTEMRRDLLARVCSLCNLFRLAWFMVRYGVL